MDSKKVPKRIANMIMNALQGGVVPRTGLGYIAVGREQEISAFLKDLELVEDGGATFRFITGNYGSGKTFLLQTIKEHAVAKGFVVADADLSPERSLVGTASNKKGLATYRELMCNISIKTSPTGGALEKILDNWLNSMWMESAKDFAGGTGTQLEEIVSNKIFTTIMEMQSMVHGYDFAHVLTVYWKAFRNQNIETKAKALRWLRGEYLTKSEAKRDFGIANIINDEDWFDYIKIFSEFFKKIHYKGFVIMIDEMINIYKARQTTTRQQNYEKMLSMYNDALQGKAHYLGIIFGGTPRSVEDTTRGVFSYEALRSRLETGNFKSLGVVNLMAPIIRINQLSKSEIVVLLEKLSEMHAELYGYVNSIRTNEIIDFVEKLLRETTRQYITPRSIIRDFINVLNVIYQNPGANLRSAMLTYQYSSDVEELQEAED